MESSQEQSRDFVIGADAFTQENSPTESQIVTDRFQNYKWIDLIIPEANDNTTNVIRLRLIEVPEVGFFILKKIRLCPYNETDRCCKLKKTLNKEIEGLKAIQSIIRDLIPEIVDYKHYKDTLEGYSYTDILFKLSGADFTVIRKALERNPKMDLVTDLIAFLNKLEEVDVPYGLILNHNCIVMEGSTQITILGIGLIEAAIIYGTETNSRAKEENIKEIGRYIRIIDPLAPSLNNITSITQLKNSIDFSTYDEYQQDTRLIDTHSDQNEGRYEQISENTFDQNWLYKPLRSGDNNFDWLFKNKQVIIGIVVLFFFSLLVAAYYGFSYYSLDTDRKAIESSNNRLKGELDVYKDEYQAFSELSNKIMDLKREKDSLTAEIELLLSIEDGRLLNYEKFNSFLSEISNFFQLVKKLTSAYRNAIKDDKSKPEDNKQELLEGVIYYVNSQVHDYRIYKLVEGNDFFSNVNGDHTILGTYTHRLDIQRKYASILFTVDDKGTVKDSSRFEGANAQQFNKMIVCKDGGIALGGYVASDSSVNANDLWIIKLNPDKTKEWSYKYPNSTNGAHSLVEDVDGGIIVVGSETKDDIWYSQFLITKITKGIVTWALSLPNSQTLQTFSTDAKAITKNSKHENYIVVGYEDNKATLIVVKNNGEILKHHHYDPDMCLHEIIEVDDGFIAIGSDNALLSDIGSHTKIYKINYEGDKDWDKSVSDDGKMFKYLGYTVEAIPGGFVVGGKKCFENHYRKQYSCGNLLMDFDLSGTPKWESQFSEGTVKKIKYENGKLTVLEDLNNAVAIFNFDIPTNNP